MEGSVDTAKNVVSPGTRTGNIMNLGIKKAGSPTNQEKTPRYSSTYQRKIPTEMWRALRCSC